MAVFSGPRAFYAITFGQFVSLVGSGMGAMSLGVLSGGPLAQHVFEPLMADGGALAGSLGQLIGVGEGRGMALMYVITGLILIALVLASALTRSLRLLEDILPDHSSASEEQPVAAA